MPATVDLSNYLQPLSDRIASLQTGLGSNLDTLGGRMQAAEVALGGKASAQALLAFSQRLSGVEAGVGVAASAADLSTGLSALRASLSSLEASLRSQIASTTDRATSAILAASPVRPGDGLIGFTSALDVGYDQPRPPLPAGWSVAGDNGSVIRLFLEGGVAIRAPIPIEDFRIYKLRLAVRRRVDARDPTNDAIRFATFCLDQSKTRILDLPLHDFGNLAVAEGRQEVSVFVSRASANGVIQLPAATRYLDLYVFKYGNVTQDDVEVLEARDVTDLLIPPTVTADLVAEIAALRSNDLPARVAVVEAQLTAPESITLASAAAVAGKTVPVSVTVIRVLAWAVAGDGGEGFWARSDATAPLTHKLKSKDGAYWAPAGAEISILQLGGSDDGVTLNEPALSRARAFMVGTGRTLAFPAKRANSMYLFSDIASVDFRGLSVRADANVKAKGQIEPYYDGLSFLSAFSIEYRSGGPGRYAAQLDFQPSFRQSPARKTFALSPSDLERNTVVHVPGTDLTAEVINFGGNSDDWVPDTGAGATATSLAWALSNDGMLHAGFLPVRGGDELNTNFLGGDYSRVAIVRFAGGYVTFRAGQAPPGTYGTKFYGLAITQTGPVYYLGYNVVSWRPENAAWTIVIYDNRTWNIKFNGVELFPPQTVPGDIEQAGFGAIKETAGSLGANIEYITRVRRSMPVGSRPMNLLVIGDSKSAPLQSGWVDTAREMLDGFRGIRVLTVNNYAVAGDNTEVQLASLKAKGVPPGTNAAIIIVGTNDVQGNAIAENTLYSYGPMIDLLQAAGVNPVIGIPDLWYATADAQGYGDPQQPTRNYEKGARTRLAIMDLAAQKGCTVVDLPGYSGPVLPSLIGMDPAIDKMLRDALHQTVYWNRLMGKVCAAAIANQYLKPMTRRIEEIRLPLATPAGLAGRLSNGWTANTQPPTYSVSAEGIVTLSGILEAGNKADGTTILTLPKNLRPINRRLYTSRTDSGAGVLVLSQVGEAIVSGIGAAPRVMLDGISYQAA